MGHRRTYTYTNATSPSYGVVSVFPNPGNQAASVPCPVTILLVLEVLEVSALSKVSALS